MFTISTQRGLQKLCNVNFVTLWWPGRLLANSLLAKPTLYVSVVGLLATKTANCRLFFSWGDSPVAHVHNHSTFLSQLFHPPPPPPQNPPPCPAFLHHTNRCKFEPWDKLPSKVEVMPGTMLKLSMVCWQTRFCASICSNLSQDLPLAVLHYPHGPCRSNQLGVVSSTLA